MATRTTATRTKRKTAAPRIDMTRKRARGASRGREIVAPRTRTARAPAPRASAAEAAAIDRLQRIKLDLQQARTKLMLVQPDLLDDAAHQKWSEDIFEVNRAINAARVALLGAISEAFAAELPSIERATGKLAEDLARLRESVAIIETVSAALGIIERIARLVSVPA
jgi:hypothetical protein